MAYKRFHIYIIKNLPAGKMFGEILANGAVGEDLWGINGTPNNKFISSGLHWNISIYL